MRLFIISALILLLAMPLLGQDEDIPVYENQHLQAAYDYLFTTDEQAEYTELLRSNNQRKLNRFWERIWKKRDPTPETEYNALKELFIRRVEDTQLFASPTDFGDSWKKDQGRVYIIFGAPDEIIRSPYGPKEMSNVEVWIYRESSEPDSSAVEIVFEEDRVEGFKLRTGINFPREIVEEKRLPEVPKRFDGR